MDYYTDKNGKILKVGDTVVYVGSDGQLVETPLLLGNEYRILDFESIRFKGKAYKYVVTGTLSFACECVIKKEFPDEKSSWEESVWKPIDLEIFV